MDEQSKKSYEQLHITAAEHPKAFAPHVVILNVVMSVLGAIIGLELIVRTGVAPNTSIVGALFAIILSRIPLKFLQKYRSIHSQNMIQTAISGATFSAANSLLLPIGIPVIMGRWDLMMPLLTLYSDIVGMLGGLAVVSTTRRSNMDIYRTANRRIREKVEGDPANPTLLCTKWGVGYYFKR